MSTRKISATQIFDGRQLLEPGTVLEVDETGVVIGLLNPGSVPSSSVEHWNGWLCPGFINAHCHLELSHMKGRIAPEAGMTDFLLQVMFNRQADASLVQYSMQNAVEEMTGNGIVAVGDICNTIDSLAVKPSSGLYWHNMIEVAGFVPSGAKTRFDSALQVADAFARQMGRGQTSLVPHAAYSVSSKLFELIQNHPQKVVCMHNQESMDEEQFIASKEGPLLKLYEALGINIDFFEAQSVTSLQYSAHMLPMAKSMLLVHNCLTNADDVHYLFESFALLKEQFYFCLCPNANKYIGNPLPMVPMLLEATPNICIGTDSLASNWQLSMLAELRTLQQAYPNIALPTLLSWATWYGAQALQAGDRLGCFAPGYKPGVLLIEGIGEGQNLEHASVQRLL